jgi:hypothetical protein
MQDFVDELSVSWSDVEGIRFPSFFDGRPGNCIERAGTEI